MSQTHAPEYFLLHFLTRNGGSAKFQNLLNCEQAMALEMVEAGLLHLVAGIVSIPA